MRIEALLRRDIVETGRKMVARGLVAATDGNLSARLDGGLVLATPSGFSKGELRESDLVVTDLEGRLERGHRKPTSELGMHLAVYRARPDVEAVVHAHPPVATGFACAGVGLEEPLVSEAVLALGPVPLAPYATTGTPAMISALEPFLKAHQAVLLSNHGVVAMGGDLRQAFWRLETVEQLAKVSLSTRLLGKKNVLGEAEVKKLLEARERYFAR